VSLIVPNPSGTGQIVKVMRPDERRSLSRSATRALDVLELFGGERRPLRAVEIGRALAMNPSTTNQLLKTMVGSGHLVFEARGKTYLPSPRLAEFSSWIVDSYGAGGRLRDLICGIRDRTGMVITVTTPNDLFMQIIDSAIPAGMTAERGLRISLFGSTIGSAYLSMLDEAEIARLADRARMPLKDLPLLLDAIAHVREQGFAEGPSGDLRSIAMPLPDHRLHFPTVLGLAGPAETVRERSVELVAAMRAAITDLIGTAPD
jgi:DNA-binding IclR family transcriptional regulator